VGDGLEGGTILLVDAVSMLLNDKAPDSRATALRVFKNRHLPTLDGWTRSMIVHYATSAGLPDGLRLYLRMLETPGNTIGAQTHERPVAETAAEEVLNAGALRDRELDEIKKKAVPPAEKVAAVKAWVKEQIAKMEAPK